MNVWVRVASHIRSSHESQRKSPDGSLKLTPELHLIVYPSKEQAEESRRKLGGIILEVHAASLGLQGQNEFGKQLILLPDDSAEGSAPSSASIAVCESGLGQKTIAKGRMAALADRTALAWRKALEKESGLEVHE